MCKKLVHLHRNVITLNSNSVNINICDGILKFWTENENNSERRTRTRRLKACVKTVATGMMKIKSLCQDCGYSSGHWDAQD